jgi:Bacterial membrane protein YfhO
VLDEPGRPWRRTAIGAAVLVLLAALAQVIFPPAWAPYVRWGAIKGALAVLLVLAVQLLAGRTSPRALALLLVAGLSADLAIAAWPHLDFAPRALATGVPRAATAILEDHRRGGEPAPPRVYRAERTEATVRRWTPAQSHAEGEAATIASLIPNTVTTFGVATLPGYDAAIPTLLPDLWLKGQKVGQSVLRLLGISYVVLPIDDPGDRVEHRSGLTPMLDPLPGSRLYRVPQALPRVYLAGRADGVTDEQAMARLFEPEVVEGKLALVAGAPLPGPAGRAGDCQLTAFSNSRVVARCQAQRPALAVFLEQHDAGWSADVDGAPAPLQRANLLMRAVPLQAGTHIVTLSYTPPGLRAGALLALSSTVILTVMSLTVPFLRRWRRPSP